MTDENGKLPYTEVKFRIGAHHAATRIAEALDDCKTAEECQRVADAFADMIGEARNEQGADFDLHQLIGRARAKVRAT